AGSPLAASDPNWFYSTLAQSTAALVGLAGGFMVSRILQQRNEVVDDRHVAYLHFAAWWGEVVDLRAQAEGAISMEETLATVAADLEGGADDVDVPSAKLATFSHVGMWAPEGSTETIDRGRAQELREFVELAKEFRDAVPTKRELARGVRKARPWKA